MTAAPALAPLPPLDPAEEQRFADDHLTALGVSRAPATRARIERLAVHGEGDGDVDTFYASDNEVTYQLRKGGVDGAESAAYGSVVVLLGIDGSLMSRVDLDAPACNLGWADMEVLNAAIAHLAIVRDELAARR